MPTHLVVRITLIGAAMLFLGHHALPAQSVRWTLSDYGDIRAAILNFENCSPSSNLALPEPLSGMPLSQRSIVGVRSVIAPRVLLKVQLPKRGAALEIPAFHASTDKGSFLVEPMSVPADIPQIAGAFGFALGGTLSDVLAASTKPPARLTASSPVAVTRTDYGHEHSVRASLGSSARTGTVYRVFPRTPKPPFEKYFVTVEEHGRLISIIATAPAWPATGGVLPSYKQALLDTLKEKYPLSSNVGTLDHRWIPRVLAVRDRYINLFEEGRDTFTRGTLGIAYIDGELFALALAQQQHDMERESIAREERVKAEAAKNRPTVTHDGL